MSPTREQPVASWRGYARWALRGVFGAALFTAGAWCWDGVAHAEVLRMRTVFVSGAFQQVSQDQVFVALRPQLAARFFALDLDAAQAAIEALPWVARATVRREWPGTLRVAVVEEQPVATWRGVALLNATGVAFVADRRPHPELPALAGPEGTAPQVLGMLRDMQMTLGDRIASIARIELSERRAWEVWFVDGTRVRLGRRDALPRLARYAEVAVPLVGPQASHIAYVDMRYANGFTIGWRGAEPQTSAVREVEKKTKRKRTDV